MELNIRIGGAAGQGVQTIGYILSKVFARGGLEVFSVMDYQSRIRGGHNYFQIRISDESISSKRDEVDILVALDRDTIDIDERDVKKDGIILYDGSVSGEIDTEKCFKCVELPFSEIAVNAAGNKLYSNSAAIGAVLGFLDYDMDILYKVIDDFFSHKKDKNIAKNNINTARAGWEEAKMFSTKIGVPPIKCKKNKNMLINGNEAITLGALAAGCKFFSSYPMTPSTSILVNAAKYSNKFEAVVEQAEDEIAAVNMIIGASYAGVRSMTTTSGGGFCLMVEGLGFAGIAEIPTVIVNAQRSGPSTGLPTRTEQGDLLFTINASHGDFLRAVLAPSSPKDAFFLTIKAFELADKYQIPVIILTDQYLADTYTTVDEFDISNIKINRNLISDEELKNINKYNRYELTESGVSPRALPGQSEHIVVSDSDEHTTDGHLTEDIEAAVEIKDKRARKLSRLTGDLELPRIYGNPAARNVLITWGSTFGVVKEFIEKRSDGKLGLINITEVWPLEGDFFVQSLEGKKGTVVEGNSSGQMTKLICQVSGIKVDSILKYDGRPFTIDYLEEKLKQKGIL